MNNVQEFVDKSDILLNENVLVEDVVKEYFEPYLLKKDYDALITMYGIFLNKEIRQRMYKYKNIHNLDELPEHLKSCDGVQLSNEVKEWQKNNKKELEEIQKQIISMLKKSYYDRQQEVPMGMIECISRIGHALIYSAMYHNEAFERDWYAISIMFALAYEGHIEIQKINKEYVELYKSANHFIREQRITLPYYYVAVWDLWKLGRDYNDKRYEYNRKRLLKTVANMPQFYINLLAGISYYPTHDRIRVLATGIDENREKVPIMTQICDVPFYYYLPTFVKSETKISKCKNGIRGDFYHPLPMMEIPCTCIHTRLDVELYLNNICKDIEMENLRKKIMGYEPKCFEYNKQGTGKNIYSHSNVSKRVKDIIELTEKEKRELLARLDNSIPKTANCVCKYETGKNLTSIIKGLEDAGYARNTYYKIKTISSRLNQKSIPTKDTLISLSCVMKLSMEQIKELLFSSGYIFSPAIERDVVIEFLLEKGNRNIVFINDYLDRLGLKTIEGRKKKE